MSKKLVIILICFFAIVVVSILLYNQLNEYKGLKDVYVAKTGIKKGTKITSDMVEVKKITLNQEGKNARSKTRLITYYDDVVTNLNDVKDKFARFDIISGEVMVKEKLLSKIDDPDEYISKIPKGYYITTWPIGDLGEAGLIRINDYIDMFIRRSDYVEDVTLRELRVYDIRTPDGVSVTSNNLPSNTRGKYLVLALNEIQLKHLNAYKQDGAVINYAIRQRPSFDKLFEYDTIDYPSSGPSPDKIIDDTERLRLIAQYQAKIENEKVEKGEASGKTINNKVNTTPSSTTSTPIVNVPSSGTNNSATNTQGGATGGATGAPSGAINNTTAPPAGGATGAPSGATGTQ